MNGFIYNICTNSFNLGKYGQLIILNRVVVTFSGFTLLGVLDSFEARLLGHMSQMLALRFDC